MNDYYVYVYIDPRNHEEFYYGKGKGSRKFIHLSADDNSEKSKIINAIYQENLSPIIKVIAANLTEKEAFLVESTLIWKLGKYTTNIASGHYSKNFRPHNTLHRDIAGFDYKNGIFNFNVGEGETRNWDDFRKYGIISAGQGIRWRDAISGFNIGDLIIAYLKNHGYVGVGKIKTKAVPILEFKKNENELSSFELKSQNMYSNSDDYEKSEYVSEVDWIKTVSRENAYWGKKSGLYTTQLVRSSLESQKRTLEFIEAKFEVNLVELLK